jgi:hypothetical protein
MDPIDSAYANIDVSDIIPSFFEWLFGGALSLNNGGMFGIGLILIVAMVSLLIFKSNGLDRGLFTSSFITMIIGLLALKANWINNFIFTLTIIYFIVGIYYLYSKRSQEEA